LGRFQFDCRFKVVQSHEFTSKVQMGQMANHLSERKKGKLPSQPVPNPKLQCTGRSSSNYAHRPEHVQAIVTLRPGRQVDNQVVLFEENLAILLGKIVATMRREMQSHLKPQLLLRILLDLLYLRHHTQTNYNRLRREENFRTFLMCSSKSKSIFHFWMSSSKCHLMPSS